MRNGNYIPWFIGPWGCAYIPGAPGIGYGFPGSHEHLGELQWWKNTLVMRWTIPIHITARLRVVWPLDEWWTRGVNIGRVKILSTRGKPKESLQAIKHYGRALAFVLAAKDFEKPSFKLHPGAWSVEANCNLSPQKEHSDQVGNPYSWLGVLWS